MAALSDYNCCSERLLATIGCDYPHEPRRARKCGYWKSLEGFPNTENKSTINVEIYKENILTPESLIQIIETAKQKRRELFI